MKVKCVSENEEALLRESADFSEAPKIGDRVVMDSHGALTHGRYGEVVRRRWDLRANRDADLVLIVKDLKDRADL